MRTNVYRVAVVSRVSSIQSGKKEKKKGQREIAVDGERGVEERAKGEGGEEKEKEETAFPELIARSRCTVALRIHRDKARRPRETPVIIVIIVLA